MPVPKNFPEFKFKVMCFGSGEIEMKNGLDLLGKKSSSKVIDFIGWKIDKISKNSSVESVERWENPTKWGGYCGSEIKNFQPPQTELCACVWVDERAAAEAKDKVETGVAGAVERIKLCWRFLRWEEKTVSFVGVFCGWYFLEERTPEQFSNN